MKFFEVSGASCSGLKLTSQTGAPVSKNSDAIKQALEAIAADVEDDVDDDDDDEGEIGDVEISEVGLSLPAIERKVDVSVF